MENRSKKSSMILKYSKRRYDGGSEAELIRAIERRQALSQTRDHLLDIQTVEIKTADLQTEITGSTAEAGHDNPLLPPAQPQPGLPEAVKATATAGKNRVLAACVLGPMELCVGVVGMMTATLAIVTFRRLNNEQLLKQSQGVFSDCFKTFRKGIVDCLTTPVRAIQAAVSKA